MNSLQSKLTIAIEPKAAPIPAFYTNESKNSNSVMSLSQGSRLSISTCASNCEDDLNSVSPCSVSKHWNLFDDISSPNKTCSCPHVLVADDDAFQHFYYQTLFNRSLTFDDAFMSREDINVKLHFSGEELLESLSKIQACGCNKLMLVISDYSMGSNRLSGVETALRVRNAGYKGKVILRTSETKEDLRKNHVDFDNLFSTNIINVMVPKDNLKLSKQIIQKLIQRN